MTLVRDFTPDDAPRVDRIAVAAFEQFSEHYSDWPAMKTSLGRMSGFAATGEMIVAEQDGRVAGAVVYVGPHRRKPAFFEQAWPIIRMLVVDPQSRGGGLGRALSEACIARALRDDAPSIALHTSPIMTVALPLYLRMGFVRLHDAPSIFGVPYAVYLKTLAEEAR